MKTKKLLTAIAGTALAVSAALSLTACGPAELGKTTLNIADYATEYASENYSYGEKSLEKALTVNVDEEMSTSLDYYGMRVLNKGTESNPSYTVYSFTYGKNILTDLSALPERNSTYRYLMYEVENESSSGDTAYTRKYYTYDGKEILVINDYPSLGHGCGISYRIQGSVISGCYVKNENTTSTVYVLAVEKNDSKTGKTTITAKYYRGVENEETGVTDYEVLEAGNVKIYGSEYDKDGNYNGSFQKVYPQYDGKPVEGEIADYDVSYNGDVYDFYNKGNKTGSVTVRNGNFLGMLGNYLYYYEMTPVGSDAKNYNCVEVSQYGEVKYNYELFRYDIVKNSNKKIDCNIVVVEMRTLYNYSAKSYDAAVIEGFEMENGVAYADFNDITYIVDKDIKLAYDMHGVNVSSSNIYVLKDGTYMIGDKIYDADMNYINDVGYNKLYKNEGLISFKNGNSYGFTDYKGKIVIEPRYAAINASGITFYGDVAYVSERRFDGMMKTAFLKADGTVKYTEDLIKTSSESERKNISVKEGYYTITTVTDSSVKVAYYNFGGKLLKEFDGGNSLSEESIDGDIYIVETTSTVKNYYKLG